MGIYGITTPKQPSFPETLIPPPISKKVSGTFPYPPIVFKSRSLVGVGGGVERTSTEKSLGRLPNVLLEMGHFCGTSNASSEPKDT